MWVRQHPAHRGQLLTTGDLWLSLQVLLMPISKTKAVSQKVPHCYLQRMARFCFSMVRACAVIPPEICQRLPTASPSVSDTSSTTGSAGSCGPNGRAACTADCTCCRTFSNSGHSFLTRRNAHFKQLCEGEESCPRILKIYVYVVTSAIF